MKVGRRQYTLGSLMFVIAVFAGILAVPGATWASVARGMVFIAPSILLGFFGFGLGHAGSKLAAWVGRVTEVPTSGAVAKHPQAGGRPCPPT